MPSDDVEGFADPWEHARLLSDRGRNDALLGLLSRRAPGARVLEIGAGTGLLSCVAARMGAARVLAVEPTERVHDAARLVAVNGLGDIVYVRQGMVEDLPPEPVDLAFSELLNADPFTEGILPAMDAARAWLAPGGYASPSRLRIWMAPVRAVPSASETDVARAEMTRFGEAVGIDVETVLEAVDPSGMYRYLDEVGPLAGPPQVIWDIALGDGWRPPEACTRRLKVAPGETAGGVVVWFEAEIEPGVWLDNGPGGGGHWGQLVCGWSDAPPPGDLDVLVEVEEDELTVRPVVTCFPCADEPRRLTSAEVATDQALAEAALRLSRPEPFDASALVREGRR
ncbi:MAG: class I SAM-dependent methyltransferase [Deltaproteobacteria bacterium]|nr:class I SAM-dependent methyltransferase [Deltaproteobacteria bacterium]